MKTENHLSANLFRLCSNQHFNSMAYRDAGVVTENEQTEGCH